MKKINEAVIRFKEIFPNIKVRKQPISSLTQLLNFEREYKMNTKDALILYIELDEEIHFNDNYKYLCEWVSEYNKFITHKGDIGLLDSIK